MNFFMFNFYPQYNNYGYYNFTPNSIFQHNTYNKAKADILVNNALAGLPLHEENPPMCAKYVKNAIVRSGLGVYVNGNGEDTKYMLRNNANFKEVKVLAKDMSKMPKGTIFVYDANEPVAYADGTSGIIGRNGHVTFKYTNNKSVSDRIEDLPLSNHAYAFIPV